MEAVPVAAGSRAGRARVAAVAASLLLALSGPARGGDAPYELVVGEGALDVTGRPVRAMTINGSVPGPVLRWREGQIARVRVRNGLAEPTSIHWHGVLVPPGMDGVPWVSFPPIPPGGSFTYELPVRQSGTYWYHSHSGLQEQRGVYGAIVIEPREPQEGGADREHVVLFSDWTDEDPARVLHTLKRGSHAYALEKGSAQSLLGAARAGMLGDFFATQLQRMPPMDIADVAYDRFLANGRPEIALAAEGLDTVRLRIVNGSATTYFHLEFAGGPMTIVSADGQEVEPVEVGRLLVAVAETYDLVVLVPPEGSWELRATAHDGSSHASAWIGAGERHPAPDVPRPNVYRAMAGLGLREVLALTPEGATGMPDEAVRAGRFDRPGAAHAGHGAGHGSAGHGSAGHEGMDHGAGGQAHGEQGIPAVRGAAATASSAPPSGRRHARDHRPLGPDASSAPRVAEEGSPERPWAPYERLRSARPTSLPADRPVREIRLTLDGDMERYTWFLDRRALWEEDTIPVRAGEALRFILVNRTMMHHPMHLHGHFFRVVNGQGDRAPLKHTADVPPMGTTVIELPADERGDWLFHCHLLYHMESGMARVVRYEGYDPGPAVAGIRAHEDHWYAWADVDLLTSHTAGAVTAARTRTTIDARWDAGWKRGERTDWEWLLTAERRVNAFLGLFAGADSLGAGTATETTRAVAGLRYLLPLLVRAQVWADGAGGGRISLEKELALLPRLEAHGDGEYDTHEGWDGGFGLRYVLARNVSLAGGWDADHGWGAGFALRF